MKNETLTILTWNCNGAFRRKYAYIGVFEADICIIQECENPATTNDKNYKEWADNFLWTGDNKNKGLGIFAKKGIQLVNSNWDSDGLKYFISCRINGEFDLLAAWCHGADSPTFGYIGQLWKYLQIHKTKLTRSIIAGDFNSNVIWDKWDRWWNHSDVVRELQAQNIESFYHKFHNENAGKELQPTFYLQRKLNKPYHIDYIFGSEHFKETLHFLSVGSANEWLKFSDDMPIVAKFKNAFPK